VNGAWAVSAPVRTAASAAGLDAIDASLRGIASSRAACEMRYPSLIARLVLERAEYPQAFPHLLLSASRMDCAGFDESAPEPEPRQVSSGWCLSPAVCYHAYAQLAGQSLTTPATISARGTCYRAERTTAPGIRQIEFAMRELVFIGPAAWVDAEIEGASRQLEALAISLGLRGEWRTAEDPFFLPRAEGKALMQRLLQVKLEYQSLDYDGLALASVNRHGSFFGERFHITNGSGEPMHTACLAAGLDRWDRCAEHQAPTREETR
jgi:hypothetical protein